MKRKRDFGKEKFSGVSFLCQYLCGSAGKVGFCASCTGQIFRQKEVLTGGKVVMELQISLWGHTKGFCVLSKSEK